ncbi:DUF1521 domain-containing protein [Variovorax sp. RHLX14]|uniref:DUF1521 domain-containing protein n=1 Tax=Variovorax sp. RHLX14 TaxID=1259731 RepID=UPI003F47830E
MSINNSGFSQKQVSHFQMSGSPNMRPNCSGANVQSASRDLWAGKACEREMSVEQGEDSTEVKTPGGYKITGFGQSSADGGKLEIVDPDGKKTTVWGDPHVDQTDTDGKSKRAFDVKNRTTFTLPDKTVITMNMKPSTNGSDTTMLSDVMITNGDKGVLMSDMMSGKGKMRTDEGYGPLMDDMVDDGNVLNMGKNGQFYETNQFGGKSKVTQESINRTESKMNEGVMREEAQDSDEAMMQQFMQHIQKLLSGFNSEFLQSLTSGSSSSYSSRHPHLGMQHMTLNTASASWF